MKIKIFQITATESNNVFGLGDDGRVYDWNYDKGQWFLYSFESQRDQQRDEEERKQGLDPR